MGEKKEIEAGQDDEYDSYAVKILRHYDRVEKFAPKFTITSDGYEMKVKWLGYRQTEPKYTMLLDDKDGVYLIRENELGKRVAHLVEQINKVYEELKDRGILPENPDTIDG